MHADSHKTNPFIEMAYQLQKEEGAINSQPIAIHYRKLINLPHNQHHAHPHPKNTTNPTHANIQHKQLHAHTKREQSETESLIH